MAAKKILLVNEIEPLIVPLRGQRVILDRDLAALYGVETRALNQAVKRNTDRFPDDFVFQLQSDERTTLADAYPHLNDIRHGRVLPRVFTEHGAIMAANVLSSPRAVEVSVLVVRAFIKLREMLMNQKELNKKFTELESRLANHDVAIQQLLFAIRQLMDAPPAPAKAKIGLRG